MNPSEFMRRWIDGMKNLSPLAQLKAQKAGIIGNLVGFLSAGAYLIYMKYYIWIIVIFFTLWLQVLELIKVSQAIKAHKEFDESMVIISEARL